MSLSPDNKYKQGSGKILTSKTLREAGKNDHDDDRPCKILRTSTLITSLPSDCLNLIFKCLETKDDRSSFGLTCHEWLHIQNNNHESLWRFHQYDPDNINSIPPDKYPKITPECLAIITCKLLIRFQRLKILCLGRLPRITDVDTLKSQSFVSSVQKLYINNCSQYSPDYSDMQLSLIFSWFPRLTHISLYASDITDRGLEVLAKFCSSLETVELPRCYSITDSGINFLLRNCRKLSSLTINHCSKVTGIGFLGCAQTLTYLEARGFQITPEGFRAIVSGGRLEYLYLLASIYKLAEDEKGCIINTEAVMTIAKGCPLLKQLSLSSCEEVELDGWKAIGLNCKELNQLAIMGCQRLCDMGLQAIWDGCGKLSELFIDEEKNSCSSFALELFMSRKSRELYLLP